MTSAERILLALNHREPDRVPICDKLWPSTIARWHKEGLPENVPSVDPAGRHNHLLPKGGPYVWPADYFGFEMVLIRADMSPQFPAEVIDEGGGTILERTPYGALRRQLRDYSATYETLEWPIKNRGDWERIKPRLRPDPSRVNWEAAQATYKSAREKGKFVALRSYVGWHQFTEYIKNEDLWILMATEPDWAKEMFQTQAELVIGMVEMMMDRGIRFDGAMLSSDLAYRGGLLFSPEMYRTLQFPYDQKVFRFLRDRGVHVIFHTDGQVKRLIPQFLEAGISALNPIECKAGMDLIELKREYGKDLAFVGGIDVRAMADPDPQIIEDEIKRKFEVAMVGGGYVYHSDHSVPHNVSFQQYQRVLELVRQYGVYR